MTPHVTAEHRVLVVEDDADIVVLLREAFTECGLRPPILEAADGDAALAYLEGVDPYQDRSLYPLPTLVLLDLKLPGRDGLEILEWIRAHERFRQLPVVVLTSSASNQDMERAYSSGANSYLVKPPTFGEITAMVQMLSTFWPVPREV
jgi:CheY-like chemotaxis protein